MYQVSDHIRSQFEKMLGLASVKEALAFIEANQLVSLTAVDAAADDFVIVILL